MIFNTDNRSDFDKFYVKEIDRLALSGEDFSVDNSNPLHALYLMNKLFLIAKKRIRLFSDHLIPVIKEGEYDELDKDLRLYSHPKLIRNMTDFLRQDGAQLDIIVEKKIDAENPFMVALKEFAKSKDMKGNYSFRQINEKNKVQLESGFNNHFLICDDKAYRVEKSHEPKCFKAFANFGDKRVHDKLTGFFDFYLTELSTSAI
ncbi:MAG: hypothetical protein COA86_02810 [Kangiella sp.]|nr:MAG: hypothetical protein COA86_02810 [Kangiella sp.]